MACQPGTMSQLDRQQMGPEEVTEQRQLLADTLVGCRRH